MSEPLRLKFWVSGVPIPQGSMRGFRFGNRVAITSDNPNLKDWRRTVENSGTKAQSEAIRAGWSSGRVDSFLLDGAMSLFVEFYLPRPKSLPKRVIAPTKKPDLDKLVRAICDALTGVVWKDDSQVVQLVAVKRYARERGPGVAITVEDISATVD